MPKSSSNTKKGAKTVKSVKAEAIQSVKGMADVLPKDELWWKSVEQAGSSVAELHDFHLIETPMLEDAALFERGVGGDTDIVEKPLTENMDLTPAPGPGARRRTTTATNRNAGPAPLPRSAAT